MNLEITRRRETRRLSVLASMQCWYVTFINSNHLSLSFFWRRTLPQDVTSTDLGFHSVLIVATSKKVTVPLPVRILFLTLCSFAKGHSELSLRSHE